MMNCKRVSHRSIIPISAIAAVAVLFAFEASAFGTVRLRNAAGTAAAAPADVTQLLALINTQSKSAVTEVGGDLAIAGPPVGGDNPDTNLLREAITSGTVVTLKLGRAMPGVVVGAWQPVDPAQPGAPKTASDGTQLLDLDDIKALANPHSPACAIMHELWEVFVAARDGDTFKVNAHPRAIGAENTIHAKKEKDARGGEQAPGKQAPGGSEETPKTPRQPEQTPTGGFYVFVSRTDLDGTKVTGWDRLRLEGRSHPDCTQGDHILAGYVGADELGPSSLPVPIDQQTSVPLCDIYLEESVFVPVPGKPALPGWAGIALAALLFVAGIFVFGKRRIETQKG